MLEPAENSWTLAEAAHLMNRAAFGTSPTELKQVHRMGRHAAVRALLSPIPIEKDVPAPPAWTKPENLIEQAKERAQMYRQANMMTQGDSSKEAIAKRQELRKMANRDRRKDQLSAMGWWVSRMVNGKAPLREKMTLFWHDHFATSIQKVKAPGQMFDQNMLFRENALGNFRDLTAKVASDPAMMLYLDMSNSSKENPNENFGRELLELFTLGEGHYTEADIKEAARAFTGYRLNRLTSTITAVSRNHDNGQKTFLGETGNFAGPDIIRIVFTKERPAHYLAEKLWLWFADDKPYPKGINSMAESLLKHDYDVAPAMEELLMSKAFYAPERRRNQIKSPIDFICQMTKQLEVELLPTPLLLQALTKLGQVPFLPPNVAGWNEGRAWINTNTLLSRYNFAGLITKGSTTAADNMKGMRGKRPRVDRFMRNVARSYEGPNYAEIAPTKLRKDPVALVKNLGFRLFQDKMPSELLSRFLDYAKTKTTDERVMDDNDVAELVHLMMSTPQYQLC